MQLRVLCSVCHWSHGVACRAARAVPVHRMTRVCIRCRTLTNATLPLLSSACASACATFMVHSSCAGRADVCCPGACRKLPGRASACPPMFMTRTCTRDSFGCVLRTLLRTKSDRLLCFLRISALSRLNAKLEDHVLFLLATCTRTLMNRTKSPSFN